jgi:hypothetical protein
MENLALYIEGKQIYRYHWGKITDELYAQCCDDLRANVCQACSDAAEGQVWDCCVLFVDDGWLQYWQLDPEFERPEGALRVEPFDRDHVELPSGISFVFGSDRLVCHACGKQWRWPQYRTALADKARDALIEHTQSHTNQDSGQTRIVAAA